MIINKKTLLWAEPIKDMCVEKHYPSNNAPSYGLTEAGYDLRIAETVIYMPDQNMLLSIDKDEGRTYHRGNFILASAIEEFQMPDNLVGVVHDKSSWARKGISVFNTVIEPGWNGFLTLEIVFHGRDYIEIPAGTGIAQVLFHQISVLANYKGHYQNQEAGPQKSVI